ncbi:DNA-binding transcriptional MerR regulator [Pseudonocardia autotrophica]|uniref:Multidrug-efflux transporter 1 regulator n=2 Tax=Pseudonocardia TaxID=1847 RepID=A0A1Y2MXB4_PSEAH|nr:Multidrug-efflux transporter 1 regulator [Pseudonocardia autotrophica]TDN75295.1 DNA-binding transcriptional MerR regulator [Pseudonocardia autotrophica]
MSIGAFAKLAELTASALRFYGDAGLLRPEQVDPSTGYRLYTESQLARAAQLRRLREIGMPLPVIGTFFAAGPDEAVQLIDDQVAKVTTEAAGVRQAAAVLKASLGEEPRRAICALPGPVLAAAVDQVVATTVHHPDVPALSGVRLEADPGSVTLTATDRYRLTTRTLVPMHPPAGTWAGTLAGDDLQSLTSRLRRSRTVTIEAGERALGLRLADGTVLHCRLLTEAFPDHHLLVNSLPEVTHRVTIGKQQTVRVLEQQAPERVGLRVSAGRSSLLLPDGDGVALDGAATGPDLTLWFELTTLYPALSHALGSDVMLDLRGPDQPATVRSADDGDLTTLVMPCRSADL